MNVSRNLEFPFPIPPRRSTPLDDYPDEIVFRAAIERLVAATSRRGESDGASGSYEFVLNEGRIQQIRRHRTTSVFGNDPSNTSAFLMGHEDPSPLFEERA